MASTPMAIDTYMVRSNFTEDAQIADCVAWLNSLLGAPVPVEDDDPRRRNLAGRIVTAILQFQIIRSMGGLMEPELVPDRDGEGVARMSFDYDLRFDVVALVALGPKPPAK